MKLTTQQALFHCLPRLNSSSLRRSSLALTMLTNVSIAFIYKEPRFGSETVSQTYMAEKLEVLEEQGEWIHVRLEDGYKGWIARFFVVAIPDDWDAGNLFYPAAQISSVYQNPDRQSTALRDVTTLSGLPVLKQQDGWVQLRLPDNIRGWVEDYPRVPRKEMDVELLVQTAFDFLGIQYFWGGRSPKGFDCSGFTQACFNLNGIQLPRDAYQQAEVGEQISDDYKQWKTGDLIFFSERPEKITHVAISLGNGDFIHASGFVKLNSLNPDHKDLYIEKYAKIYTKATRNF